MHRAGRRNILTLLLMLALLIVSVGAFLYHEGIETEWVTVAGLFFGFMDAVALVLVLVKPVVSDKSAFKSCANRQEAIDTILGGKGERWGFQIPCMAVQSADIDSSLVSASNGKRRGLLVLAPGQCGKTRQLVEFVNKNWLSYGTVLVYKSDEPLLPVRSEHLSGSQPVLLLMDDLHVRCRRNLQNPHSTVELTGGRKFLDELVDFVECLEEKHAIPVSIVLTCRSYPSDLRAIDWPDNPFWRSVTVLRIPLLAKDELVRFLLHLARQVSWELERTHQALIESQWTPTFEALVNSFSRVQICSEPASALLWQEYQRETEHFWQNFIRTVEQQTPGGTGFFEAIYWLQHLEIPLRRELIVAIFTEWSRTGRGDAETILKELEQYAMPPSETSEVLNVMPVQFRAKHRGSEAIETFMRILEAFREVPQHDRIFDLAYTLAVEYHELEDATTLWNRLTSSPVAGLALFDLGLAYEQLEQPVEAVNSYYLSLSHLPGVAHLMLSQSDYVSIPAGLSLLSNLEQQETDSTLAGAYLALCERLMSMSEQTESARQPYVRELLVEISARALAHDQENSYAWWNRARVLAYLQHPIDALQAFEKALELAPDSEDVYYEAALFRYFTADKIADARKSEQRLELIAEMDDAEAEARRYEVELTKLRIDRENARDELESLRLQLAAYGNSARFTSRRPLAHLHPSMERQDAALLKLEGLVERRRITRSALEGYVEPWLFDAREQRKMAVDREKLDNLLNLLETHPDHSQCQIDRFIDPLRNLYFDAEPGSELASRNVELLSDLQHVLVDLLTVESMEIENVQARVDALGQELFRVDELANKREQVLRRVHETQALLWTIEERYDSERAGFDRAKKQVQELHRVNQELDSVDLAQDESRKALAWAERAYQLGQNVVARDLVSEIESSIKGESNVQS